MLKAECPHCHALVDAEIKNGQLIIGQHANERGWECSGWGKQLDLPTGTSLSADTKGGDGGLHGFKDN